MTPRSHWGDYAAVQAGQGLKGERREEPRRAGGGRGARGLLLQMGLDFDLPAKLVLHALLFYLGLEEDFEGHDEMAFLLPSQVHVAKLAFAQRPPNLKVLDGEGSPAWGGGGTGGGS